MKNYIEQALRTKSNQFHPDGVCPEDLVFHMVDFIEASISLDAAKKALFYGKEKTGTIENPICFTHPKFNPLSPNDRIDFFHGVIGIATEAGELLEGFHEQFDPVNLKEELGDMLWYIAILCNVVGCSIEDLMELNINKLKARYPDKFTSENAIHRDLETERQILEK